MKRKLRQEDIKRLLELWDDGKAASGAATPFDIERIIACAEARREKDGAK